MGRVTTFGVMQMRTAFAMTAVVVLWAVVPMAQAQETEGPCFGQAATIMGTLGSDHIPGHRR